MPARKLIRPTYRQPNGVIRTDAYRHGDSAIEIDDYHRPLEQVHGSGLHGWGVADGLRVTATLNVQDLKIEPGIAIDKDGRHVALAVTANAEIGPNADNPGTAPNLIAVNADGALFPTNGLSGDQFVTVQFWETFDATAYANDGLYRFHHTPWIRMRPVGGFVDDGTLIVLARATLNPAGQVTGLTYGPRRQAVLPTGGVELRYPFVESPAQPPPPAQNRAIGNRTAGRIVPREGGGLEVRVPNAADQIEIEADAGTFAKLALAAQQIVARRGDGRESVSIDTQIGNITAGTQGVDGDILVRDSANRLIITLDSHDAALVVGANGKEGDILVKDNAGQDSVRADGNTGTVFLRRTAPANGNAIDVDATFLRVHGWDLMLDGRSGGNKRALVDLGNRLAVNYATDYANGVDIGKLHLADHIRAGFWEERGEWNPGREQWHTFFSADSGLPNSEWRLESLCEIGMFDRGSVNNFWWQTNNTTHVNQAGNIVIEWQIEYSDDGTDWMPWHRAVMWIAFRR